MEVTLEDAYAEACRMLGEAMVRERITNKLLSETRSPSTPAAEEA